MKPFALIVGLAVACPAGGLRAAVEGGLNNDYQAVAAAAAWDFSDKAADAARSAAGLPKEYKADVVRPEGDVFRATIRIRRGDTEVFTFQGHAKTPFAVAGDVLYYADHHLMTSGCSVAAVDLKTGKTLWTTHLKGLGPIDHTKYFNAVNLLVENAEVVRIYGKESAGRYVELVDRRTGKTVGHKVFKEAGQ